MSLFSNLGDRKQSKLFSQSSSTTGEKSSLFSPGTFTTSEKTSVFSKGNSTTGEKCRLFPPRTFTTGEKSSLFSQSSLNKGEKSSLFSPRTFTTGEKTSLFSHEISFSSFKSEGKSTNQDKRSPSSSTAKASTQELFHEHKIPPKLRMAYTSIKLISAHVRLNGTTSIFEAKSTVTNELHTINVLQTSSVSTRGEEDVLSTLFLQELLHLCSTQPELVIISSFIMDDNTFAYSLRSSTTLKAQLEAQKNNNSEEKSTLINIPRMISDVVSDVEFLWKERKIRGFGSAIRVDDIFYDCNNKKYWLGNWTNIFCQSMLVTSYEDNSNDESLTSQDISEELSALGLLLKELKELTYPSMEEQATNIETKENESNQSVENQFSKKDSHDEQRSATTTYNN